MNPSIGSAASPGVEKSEGLRTSDLEAIQIIQDDFARQLQIAASAILSMDIAVRVSSIRQDTYAGLQKELSPSAYICPADLSPDKRALALHLTPELIFPILEVMMGGAAAGSPVDPSRLLTAVEKDVLEPLIQVTLRSLSKAWRSVEEIDFNHGSDLPLSHETVIAVTVDFEITEEIKGSLSIALPTVLLRKLRTRTERQTRPVEPVTTEQQSEQMLKLIQPAMLEFEARLDGPRVGLRDLLNLTEGQIVLLDKALEGSVDGLLNKSPYFKGQVVSDGKKRLLLIEGFREPETA